MRAIRHLAAAALLCAASAVPAQVSQAGTPQAGGAAAQASGASPSPGPAQPTPSPGPAAGSQPGAGPGASPSAGPGGAPYGGAPAGSQAGASPYGSGQAAGAQPGTPYGSAAGGSPFGGSPHGGSPSGLPPAGTQLGGPPGGASPHGPGGSPYAPAYGSSQYGAPSYGAAAYGAPAAAQPYQGPVFQPGSQWTPGAAAPRPGGPCTVKLSENRTAIVLADAASGAEQRHVALGQDRVQKLLASPDGAWSVAVWKVRGEPRHYLLALDLVGCREQEPVEIPSPPSAAAFEQSAVRLTFEKGERTVELRNRVGP